MTADHLRPLLDNERDTRLLFAMGEQLSRAETPRNINEVIRLGRMTALQKSSGGVRGIIVGDIVRRLVGRTMAQQMSNAVKAAMAPFQYALSSRAGRECIAHALQTISELQQYCR